MRIDDGDSALGWKPQSAIASPDAGRLIAAVAFEGTQAVALAIGDRRDRLDSSGGELVQLTPADAIDPAIAADPEVAVIVFENLEHAVIEEPVFGRVPGEDAVLDPRQPAVVASDPQHAIGVLIDGAHVLARQARCFAVARKPAAAEPGDPRGGAAPEDVAACLENDGNAIVRQPVAGR